MPPQQQRGRGHRARRGFIISCGVRNRTERDPYVVDVQAVCPICQKRAIMRGFVQRISPTIFFLPLGILEKCVQFMVCGSCGTRLNLEDILDATLPAATPANQCGQCHSDLDMSAAFCPRCGQARAPVADSTQQQPLEWRPKRRTNYKPWIVTLVALVLLPALIVYVHDSSKQIAQAQPAREDIVVIPPRHREAYAIEAPPRPATTAPANPATLPAAKSQPEPELQRSYHLVKTPMLGSSTGGGPFQKWGHGQEPIIGFRITPSHWARRTIIQQIEPIYASDNLVITPSMMVARPGYAVGGVRLNGDNQVTAMQVIFLRDDGDRLNTADAYESNWIGVPTDGGSVLLGANGNRVVGIYGRQGMNIDALGLVLSERD